VSVVISAAWAGLAMRVIPIAAATIGIDHNKRDLILIALLPLQQSVSNLQLPLSE
jgi:hypothetical protein